MFNSSGSLTVGSGRALGGSVGLGGSIVNFRPIIG